MTRRRARPSEVHHASARAVVEGVLRGDDVLVVPSRFGIDVVASLARRGHPVAAALAFLLRAPLRARLAAATRAFFSHLALRGLGDAHSPDATP